MHSFMFRKKIRKLKMMKMKNGKSQPIFIERWDPLYPPILHHYYLTLNYHITRIEFIETEIFFKLIMGCENHFKTDKC